jgi:hypothetical protein
MSNYFFKDNDPTTIIFNKVLCENFDAIESDITILNTTDITVENVLYTNQIDPIEIEDTLFINGAKITRSNNETTLEVDNIIGGTIVYNDIDTNILKVNTIEKLTPNGNIIIDDVDLKQFKNDFDLLPSRLKNLTNNEVQQLENINNNTISSNQWHIVGDLNQHLNTSSSVNFDNVITSNSNLNNLQTQVDAIPLYNQSLNTTDDVSFNKVFSSNITVSDIVFTEQITNILCDTTNNVYLRISNNTTGSSAFGIIFSNNFNLNEENDWVIGPRTLTDTFHISYKPSGVNNINGSELEAKSVMSVNKDGDITTETTLFAEEVACTDLISNSQRILSNSHIGDYYNKRIAGPLDDPGNRQRYLLLRKDENAEGAILGTFYGKRSRVSASGRNYARINIAITPRSDGNPHAYYDVDYYRDDSSTQITQLVRLEYLGNTWFAIDTHQTEFRNTLERPFFNGYTNLNPDDWFWLNNDQVSNVDPVSTTTVGKVFSAGVSTPFLISNGISTDSLTSTADVITDELISNSLEIQSNSHIGNYYNVRIANPADDPDNRQRYLLLRKDENADGAILGTFYGKRTRTSGNGRNYARINIAITPRNNGNPHAYYDVDFFRGNSSTLITRLVRLNYLSDTWFAIDTQQISFHNTLERPFFNGYTDLNPDDWFWVTDDVVSNVIPVSSTIVGKVFSSRIGVDGGVFVPGTSNNIVFQSNYFNPTLDQGIQWNNDTTTEKVCSIYRLFNRLFFQVEDVINPITIDQVPRFQFMVGASSRVEIRPNETLIMNTLWLTNVPAGSGDTLRISSNNFVVRATSSKIYKHEIEYDYNADFIYDLKPCMYKLKPEYDENQEQQYGLIAQDLLEDERTKPFVRGKDDDSYSLNYEQFVSPLIVCIQELKQEILELRLRVSELENKS